jgi:hypothetical protein
MSPRRIVVGADGGRRRIPIVGGQRPQMLRRVHGQRTREAAERAGEGS